MLDWVFVLIAVVVGGAGGGERQLPGTVSTGSVVIGSGVEVGDSGSVVIGGGAAGESAAETGPVGEMAKGFDISQGTRLSQPRTAQEPEQPDVPQYEAEPQTPTGKFTTATEIKPILSATKGSWAAVREYNGQDLIYFTHLLAWRCGLVGIHYSINDGPQQVWPMPPCHEDSAAPNAITGDDGLPYIEQELKSVRKLSIEVVFDDLSTDNVSFERNAILMP